MIKSFSAQNYRNLSVDELALCPVNVFIGPNNSGKSNLIDAISFFPDMFNWDGRESAFLEQIKKRGWNELLNRAVSPPGKVVLSWTLSTDDFREALRYEMRFLVDGPTRIPGGFYIDSEILSFARAQAGSVKPFHFIDCHGTEKGRGRFAYKDAETKRTKTVRHDVDAKDTVLRQLQTLLDNSNFYQNVYPQFQSVAQEVTEHFRGFRQYSSTLFDLEAGSSAQEIDTTLSHLDTRGKNFANVLGNLDNTHNFLPTYEDRLRELLPALKRVKIAMASERYRQVELDFGVNRFKMRELSDGTKKLMLLALLLHSPSRPRLLAIDEPELNLHPAWLQVVGRWIQSASDTQLFVSTHSPDLLDSFTEGFVSGHVGIYVCDSSKSPQVSRLSLDRVKTQLAEGWKLGDLYRIGEPLIGGWPV